MRTVLKPLLPLLAIILMVACNDEPYSRVADTSPVTGNGSPELSQEARSLALGAMQWFGESRSRSNGFAIDESSIESFTTNGSRSSECDTLFQIINFQDSAGYAIVGNVGGRKQLLAAVNGGHLSLSDNNLPVQDAILLESARRYVVTIPRDTVGTGIRPGSDILYQTKTVIDTLKKECVEPLIGLHWGQVMYTSDYCPNDVAGCTPVAIAQMMAYFKPQGKFYYTYPGADIPYEYINWDEISKHKGNLLETQCPESVHQTIPRLVREVGQRCNAQYHAEYHVINNETVFVWGTSVSLSDIRPGLNSLLPNCTNSDITEFSYSSVMNTLRARGIVLILGTLEDLSEQNSKPQGHAWLAEGYRFYNIRYRLLRKEKGLESAWGYEEPWEVIEENISDECYIYYNMGFEGSGDRFVLSDLDNAIMNNHGTCEGDHFTLGTGPFHYLGYDMKFISVKKK